MNKRLLIIAAAVMCAALVVTFIALSHRRAAPGKPVPQAKPARPVRVPVKEAQGRIAIVIDDVGYSAGSSRVIGDLRYPVTVSVLPHLQFSTQAAGELEEKNVQVILHMPMEPLNEKNVEKSTILTSMDDQAIRTMLDSALASIGNAKGISNHQGSKATEDARTMSVIFSELKKKNLFFLDSFVTPRSICRKEAAAAGLRFAQRDVFLDNELDPARIRAQLAVLMRKARQNGSAIGIGHDRKATLEVLKEEMPKMAEEGVTFVFLSELVK